MNISDLLRDLIMNYSIKFNFSWKSYPDLCRLATLRSQVARASVVVLEISGISFSLIPFKIDRRRAFAVLMKENNSRIVRLSLIT